MGGCGSGGWNLKYDLTTDDVRRLDVHELRRLGYFLQGAERKITRSMNGLVQLELGFRFDRGRLFVSDATAVGSPNPDEYAQDLGFVMRSRAIGGDANLFQCPQCGAARWHLYIPRFRLICRNCAGLTYKSGREPHNMKLWREWEKISARLGGVRFDECYGMAKPKGTHTKTFERLRLRLFRTERVIERELHQSFRRYMRT